MFDLSIVWYNDVLDQTLPLKFEFLKLLRQLLCHTIRGELLRSFVRDDEHPYRILNGCVWHSGTRVCLSGGCFAKACPKQFDIAIVPIV